MRMKNTKRNNFFTRIKKAIFNFDEYEKFITESIKKAIGYFVKILLLFSLIITIALIYQTNTQTKKTIDSIEKNFPNFIIENNILELEGVENFEYYFEEINLEVIMDENAINVQNTDYTNGLILLKNKMILRYNGLNNEVLYEDIFSQSISKKTILEITRKKEWNTILVIIGIIIFIVSFIIYAIIFSIDVITLAILGLIINMIIKTTFKFKEILKISIYSMSLPIVLYLLYIVLNIIYGITIKYFEIAYNTISFIYLITVLLIMKSDLIKNTQELQKILEEQKRVKEELERERQEEKEKKEEANRQPKDKKKEKTKGEPQTEN